MKHVAALDAASDLFGERPTRTLRTRARVLGGIFDFESTDRRLLQLVSAAYDKLPAHVFCDEPPRFRIRLVLSNTTGLRADDPPPMRLHSGAGLLCGTMDAGNFAIVSPPQRTALVAISVDMLRSPYHARYELIEFAVYTLASRVQQLVPLHAACVGRHDRGLLLIGSSGAGKSTLTLHCLSHGMELVSEDSALVEPDSMLATGIGNFLHLRTDSTHLPQTNGANAWIRKSSVIRRRSGVEKFELDLRSSRYLLARGPLKVDAVVFLSKRRATKRETLLTPLGKSELRERLAESQSYAASQPGWKTFSQHASRIGAFELRRAQSPDEAGDALRSVLD